MQYNSSAPREYEVAFAFVLFLAPVLALFFFVPPAIAIAGHGAAMSGLVAGWAIIATATAAIVEG